MTRTFICYLGDVYNMLDHYTDNEILSSEIAAVTLLLRPYFVIYVLRAEVCPPL